MSSALYDVYSSQSWNDRRSILERDRGTENFVRQLSSSECGVLNRLQYHFSYFLTFLDHLVLLSFLVVRERERERKTQRESLLDWNLNNVEREGQNQAYIVVICC